MPVSLNIGYLRRPAAIEMSFCKQRQEFSSVNQQQLSGYRTNQARNSRLLPSITNSGTGRMLLPDE
jgi:hypothetical protein